MHSLYSVNFQASSGLPAATILSRRSGYGSLKRSGRIVQPKHFAASCSLNSPLIEERINKLPKLVGDVFQASISTGPRGLMRLTQGIQTTMIIGSEFLLEMSKNDRASTNILDRFQFGLLSPVYLRRFFEAMGATYIKLGQFIASTPTLFPEAYVKEFQKCFDKAPAVPFHEIKAIIQNELKKPLESIYEYIDPVPMASASIAQVHAAKLKSTGKDVVIKVLKPGIEDFVIADLNFLYIVGCILDFLNPQISRMSVVDIIGDLRKSMLEEVDFYKEAANIEAFRSYLKKSGLTRQAAAPEVYYPCSTKRVLTMERLYGIPLTDLESVRSLVYSPEESLITALNVWFGSLLFCDTFHADVHAGNLWLLHDGRIGFLDFGIVGHISPRTWNALQTFLTAVATNQYDAMAVSLVQMGATNDAVDIRSFASDLEKIFSSLKEINSEIIFEASRGAANASLSANLAVDEKQMNALFLDLVQTSESYGLKFPREFALLIKQFLYFDRYTRLLAPQLNILEDDRIALASRRNENAAKRLQGYQY
eukprot:TRINITY_DN2003_c0_g1_i1.p1 TRINITY_DN2003_c0_g1~~TRINITY_DN2003_c0_g1_i1.p1  ORF type:complete len:537 (+),score=90.07 TRINITY_DN2003_c0_g1_i1:138-1748(+)